MPHRLSHQPATRTAVKNGANPSKLVTTTGIFGARLLLRAKPTTIAVYGWVDVVPTAASAYPWALTSPTPLSAILGC